MYVCCCLAVTQSEVASAIQNGAHTREAVTRACRAGGDCGACHGMIETMIEDHLDEVVVSGVGAESGPELVSRPRMVAHDALLPPTGLVRGRAA